MMEGLKVGRKGEDFTAACPLCNDLSRVKIPSALKPIVEPSAPIIILATPILQLKMIIIGPMFQAGNIFPAEMTNLWNFFLPVGHIAFYFPRRGTCRLVK